MTFSLREYKPANSNEIFLHFEHTFNKICKGFESDVNITVHAMPNAATAALEKKNTAVPTNDAANEPKQSTLFDSLLESVNRYVPMLHHITQ